MSALSVASLFPEFGALTSLNVDRWVVAALAQADALHQHDNQLYPADSSKLPAALRLRDAWLAWADDAESLLARTAALG